MQRMHFEYTFQLAPWSHKCHCNFITIQVHVHIHLYCNLKNNFCFSWCLLTLMVSGFLDSHQHYIDGWTEHLVVSFASRPTNTQGNSGFLLLILSIFYPDMFRQLIAETILIIKIHYFLEHLLVFLQTITSTLVCAHENTATVQV
jgi:hypothetical protein